MSSTGSFLINRYSYHSNGGQGVGQTDPTRQVLHYLRDKELLLLLDNFKQLLPVEGVELLDVSQLAGSIGSSL